MSISEIHKEQIESLQELLRKTYDAQEGYILVMQKAEIKPLKDWLEQKSKRRAYFANELGSLIRKLGGTPVQDGSKTGTIHRGWIDVKSALSSNTDEVLMKECLRGEEASMKEYESQMAEITFNAETKSILYGQKESIQHSIQTIESIEDLLD